MSESQEKPQQANVGHQRKPLQIPIAPLLARSRESEKENRRPTSCSTKNAGSAMKITAIVPVGNRSKIRSSPSTGTDLVKTFDEIDVNRSACYAEDSFRKANDDCLGDNERSFSVPRPSSQATNRLPRLLRYGETVESLFCLYDQSIDEHKQLCQDIVEGRLADDAKTWRRILEFSSAGISPDSSRGKDLLRLHRRAISRLAPSESQSSSSDILAIWLSYAISQAKYGSIEEARMTFRRIQNQRLGLNDASFYLAVAEVERNFDMEIAINTLTFGIEQKAEPVDKLKAALWDLENQQRSDSSVQKTDALVSEKDNQLSTEKRLNFPVRVPPLRSLSQYSPRKRNEQSDIPSKRLKTSNSHFEDSPRSKEKTTIGGTVAKLDGSDVRARTQQKSSKGTYLKDSAGESELISSVGKPRRVEMFAKTPRVTKSGISGKAQRVDPGLQEPEHDVDPGAQTDDASALPVDAMVKSSQSSVPNMVKMDLSYILNWDPNARRLSQNTNETENPPSSSMTKPSFEKNEEPSAAGLSSSSSASTRSSNYASCHSTGRTCAQSQCHDQCRPHDCVGVNRNSCLDGGFARESVVNDRSVSSETAALVAKSSVEFLPLVAESNILRVNGKPYMKLSVIGTGGSCKVYRALSKDCAIVAIKKVKLDGMDRKAVDGYANEIALLKRLRGNPAIIEMIDSEVDLTRKSIFLVLELGEIDLNQVLQQQALRAGKHGSNGALNMNFIRLTWQQMLGAVHCIHEERIIHGDLKPANFLFVRGILKLIDFGIAKAIQSEDTTNIYRESQIIGTLNYLSPEAILNTGSDKNSSRMKIGRASDIWSLGCILYQMVYGKTPFAELHTIPKLQAIINPDYKINFAPNVDEAAVDAMKLCLRRDPQKRPPIVGKHGLLSEHWFLHSTRRT